MSDEKKPSDQVEDTELNDLLDSALEDFNNDTTSDTKTDSEASATTPKQELVEPSSEDDTWTKDFLKQAADQFEKNLQNLILNGADNDLASSLQKIAQTGTSAITDNESVEGGNASVDFQNAIAQALKDLSTTSENLQNDTDLAAMFSQTSLEEGAADFLPFMQGMMQSLLSKEVLYPSLKEVVDKYPEWLEEKKTTLSSADLQRFNKQLDLMRKVCNELEKEKDDDSEQVKKSRFEVILSLMQEMQSCGQPPEDLVGEQPAIFQFDADGNPVIPTMPSDVEAPQNCCLM